MSNPKPKAAPERISDDELIQLEQLDRLARKAKDALGDHLYDLSVKYGLRDGDQVSWSGRIRRKVGA